MGKWVIFFSYYLLWQYWFKQCTLVRVLFHCLTNDQSLQIIEFYYQNACFIKKVYRALIPFYGQFNRPTAKFFPAIAHFWTLNHQHAYVECELKKISQLYRPVLMMTIKYRFVAVRSNCASVTQQRGKLFGGISVWRLSKYSWCKNLPNFWWMSSWKVGQRSTSLSKDYVQRRSSFYAQWIRK